MMDFIKKFFGIYDLIETIKLKNDLINTQDKMIKNLEDINKASDRIIETQDEMLLNRNNVIILQDQLIKVLQKENKKS
jgi:hypothetical protein